MGSSGEGGASQQNEQRERTHIQLNFTTYGFVLSLTFGVMLLLSVFVLPLGSIWNLVLASLSAASLGAIAAMEALKRNRGETQADQRPLPATAAIMQTAIDHLCEGLVLFDRNEAFVMCNEFYRSLYPELAAKLVPGARRHELAADMMEARAVDGVPHTPETGHDERTGTFRSPHGTSEMQLADGRWILQRDHTLPDGGTIGIHIDISEIKKREMALVDSERRHRDLVERAPAAIFVHRDDVIIYANATTAEMLGYKSVEHVIGLNVFDLVHADHRNHVRSRIDKARTTASPVPQTDIKLHRADGTIIFAEAQVNHTTFDGQPALESILRNITARRRTERALMESEFRYRTLFDLAPDAMLVHNGRNVLFANSAAAKVFGAQDERALVQLPLLRLLPENSRLPEDSGLVTFNKTGEVTSCRFARLDQHAFDAEVVTAPTDYHGEAVYHTVIRDVTQRKLLDASMAQNAKLASLGGMAASLAHELSQPLNIMRFAADGGLLKMSRGKAGDDLHLKNYTLIQDQAERMGSIMDTMRIFSRKAPVSMTAFDVNQSIAKIVNLLSAPCRADNVRIHASGATSDLMALGSAVQLEQVLLNLLINARDSILERHQSQEPVRPGRIGIGSKLCPNRRHAVITISDNGAGINAEHIDHIFDPFFTTKEVGQGTGLGLALSHEIIIGMAGTLSARNIPEGACFTITLPIVEHSNDQPAAQLDDTAIPSAPSPPLSVPERTAQGHHILVVEDEIEAANAMADYLSEEGFSVTVANDGETGLAMYRELNPDLVITDIRMPGLSGTDLIFELRNINSELPIIVVTGHLGETKLTDIDLNTAPISVLRKPVSLMELTRKIAGLCAP